jgi:putative oxidoreductase
MTPLKQWIQALPEPLRPSPAVGFDLVRAYLGIGLFVRGVLFISEPSQMLSYLSSSSSWFVPYALTHYIALAHLGGGILLALGLVTRLAALAQLPVLFGAVFWVHSTDGLLSAGQSLEFSALVLMLLGVYLVIGSGPLSLDNWLGEKLTLLDAEVQGENWKPASAAGGQPALASRRLH